MDDYRGNQELEDELLDLHKGLHVALDALASGDKDRAVEILRQVDQRLSAAINTMKR